jgi:hypothetical protein
MMCKLTVLGQTRCDVGWSKGTGNDMDLKSLYSDAFKRAAVKFGIGVSIYALPQTRLKAPEIKLVRQELVHPVRRHSEAGAGLRGLPQGPRRPVRRGARPRRQPRLAGRRGGPGHARGDGHRRRRPRRRAAAGGAEGRGPAGRERSTPKAVPKIIAAFTARLEDAERGRDVPRLEGLRGHRGAADKSMEEAFGLLTSDQAAQLHAWLKASA